MKSRLLIIVAISIFVTLIVFVGIIYSINLEMDLKMKNTGPIDYDPDLSPSYAPYYYRMLQFDSIFVMGPIMAAIISLLLIVPNIVLRIKKTPTRKYMLVITACILMFFGFSYVENGLSSLTPERLESSTDYRINLIGALIPVGIGAVFIIPAIIVLKRAKLRIRK